jgi:hypothetical protein
MFYSISCSATRLAGLGLALLFSITQAFGTTYYVDSIGGSDSNNGTSKSTPWKTISQVSSPGLSYIAGDSILLKCGSAWTQGTSNFTSPLTTPNSGQSANPITYGHYVTSGSCTTLPILDGNGALDPLMRITKNNIIVDGLWFRNAKAPTGDMLDYGGATNIKILNNHFTDTAWAAIISETASATTALIDGNTCDATSGHVQLSGCVKIQGPSTTTVTHNFSDMRNLNTASSGANCIHFEVSGSSNGLSRIDSNTMYGGTQGVSFKPGSCPTGGTPGVSNCYTARNIGGSMSDNYINGVKRFGSSTHTVGADTCVGTPVGDGESIELEGHPSPFTSGGVTLSDVSMTGVTVARNIIIGTVGTTGVTGNHDCSNDTQDAIGTYFSSAFIYGNVMIGPFGTYNAMHYGGRDAASAAPSLVYNNTFVQDASLTIKTGTAVNNQTGSGSGYGSYRNNIFVGYPKALCCGNGSGASEDYDIMFNVATPSSGVTLGSHTRTSTDPKLVLSTGHYRTAEDVKLQDIVSPAIGTGQAQSLQFADILNSQPTFYPYGTSTQGPLWNVGAFGPSILTGPPNVGCIGPCKVITGAKISGAVIP